MPEDLHQSIIAAEIAPDILLDSRRALIHRTQGWMALSDLHYGYEIHRSRLGALLPNWGMNQCRATLLALIDDYRPQRLILVGDIMDGTSTVAQAGAFLDHLRSYVPELILIEGNHDRSGLKRGWQFQKSHVQGAFHFHHGHRSIALPSVPPEVSQETASVTLITGHVHPTVSMTDSTGARLKLPAFIQHQFPSERQRWILPAFSPWASQREYTAPQAPLATWACAPTRVWKITNPTLG